MVGWGGNAPPAAGLKARCRHLPDYTLPAHILLLVPGLDPSPLPHIQIVCASIRHKLTAATISCMCYFTPNSIGYSLANFTVTPTCLIYMLVFACQSSFVSSRIFNRAL